MSNQKREERFFPGVFYLSGGISLCERFGYFILSFLLVLFSKAKLGLSDSQAFELFAIVGALSCVTPAIGGYLADNIIGIRRSIVLGLILEVCGFLTISIPNNHFFFVGIALSSVGFGFFKTGPSNLIARALGEDKSKIDSIFTAFYILMNIGALLSPIAGGYLQAHGSWHLSFFCGALMALLALLIYFILRNTVRKYDVPSGYQQLSARLVLMLFLGITVTIGVIIYLLTHLSVGEVAIYFASGLLLLFLLYQIIISSVSERLRIIKCLSLMLVAFVFFLLYSQMYTSVMLYLKRCVSNVILGHHFPVIYLISLNPFWIIVIGPLLAFIYGTLAKRRKDLSVSTKILLGVIVTGVSFFVLSLSIHFTNADFKVSPFWMVASMFFYSLGELLVSALGVAMIAHIAPKRLYGVLIGAWFLIASALASDLSGKLAEISSIPATMHLPQDILHVYGSAFFKMGLLGLVVGLFGFIIMFFVSHMIPKAT